MFLFNLILAIVLLLLAIIYGAFAGVAFERKSPMVWVFLGASLILAFLSVTNFHTAFVLG